MSHHDNRHGALFFPSLLDDSGNAYFMVSQNARYLGKNPGLVNSEKSEIIGGDERLDGLYRDGAFPGVDMGKGGGKVLDALSQLSRQIDNIRNHGTARRFPARAITVIKVRAHKIAIHIHGIVDPVDVRHDVAEGNHGRVNPRFNAFFSISCDGEQFEAIPEFMRKLDILGGEPVDAFPVDTAESDRKAEGHGYKDGEFVGCIGPIHIEGRRILSISEFNRLLYGLIVGLPFLGHSGQNVVGCPVQDPHDCINTVCRETIPQSANDGNASSHTCLKGEGYILFLGGLIDLLSMFRKEGLISGDDLFSLFKCLENKTLGNINATHEFYDNINIGIIDDLHGIRG